MPLLRKAFCFKGKADESGSFTGYASVFGEVDSYNEMVAPGAFGKSIEAARAKGRMPGLFWQHDSYEPIGAWEKIEEDEKGLPVEGRLLIDDIPRAKQAHALMKANALTGLSIGYELKAFSYDKTTGITTLTEIDLWEVSLVSFPALDSARVDSVKRAAEITNERDFESFLRDSGFSKAQATAIASRGFRASIRRDSGMTAQISALRDAAQKLRIQQ